MCNVWMTNAQVWALLCACESDLLKPEAFYYFENKNEMMRVIHRKERS